MQVVTLTLTRVEHMLDDSTLEVGSWSCLRFKFLISRLRVGAFIWGWWSYEMRTLLLGGHHIIDWSLICNFETMPFFMIFCCRLHLVSTQQDIDERILNSGKVGFDMSSVGRDCAAQNLADILIELGFYLCNGKDSMSKPRVILPLSPALNVCQPFRWHWWKTVRRASPMQEL